MFIMLILFSTVSIVVFWHFKKVGCLCSMQLLVHFPNTPVMGKHCDVNTNDFCDRSYIIVDHMLEGVLQEGNLRYQYRE